jgi:hypothetical protein
MDILNFSYNLLDNMLLVVTQLIALFKSFNIKSITYCINNHKIILTKITYKKIFRKDLFIDCSFLFK